MPETQEAKTVELWASHQQGGSSKEWYLHLYDSQADAEAGIREIKGASYDACGPYKVPEALAAAILNTPGAEAEFVEFVDSLVTDTLDENFSDLEPAESDDDEADEAADDEEIGICMACDYQGPVREFFESPHTTACPKCGSLRVERP